MEVSKVTYEYKRTYPCEYCNDKTYPSFEYLEAEKHDASIGGFIIRKHVRTGKETRRSVLCYQCMRKKQPEDLCTEDEIPLMSFVSHTERYEMNLMRCHCCDNDSNSTQIITRHSQHKDYLSQHDKVVVCLSCVKMLKACHELTTNPHTNELNFVADQLSQRKF